MQNEFFYLNIVDTEKAYESIKSSLSGEGSQAVRVWEVLRCGECEQCRKGIGLHVQHSGQIEYFAYGTYLLQKKLLLVTKRCPECPVTGKYKDFGSSGTRVSIS